MLQVAAGGNVSRKVIWHTRQIQDLCRRRKAKHGHQRGPIAGHARSSAGAYASHLSCACCDEFSTCVLPTPQSFLRRHTWSQYHQRSHVESEMDTGLSGPIFRVGVECMSREPKILFHSFYTCIKFAGPRHHNRQDPKVILWI